LKNIYEVRLVQRNDIKDFTEKWHYSKSINGVNSKYCFGLFDRSNTLSGSAIYGSIAMANVWRKYAESKEEVIELRRLCLLDDTPTNAESWFIGKTLRWLQNNTSIKVVVSYADAWYGHSGTIYQASNFEYLGKTNPSRMIEWNGKLWHDKTIRTYSKGKLKPYAQRIKDALERGDAKYIKSAYKHIYLYDLESRRKKKRMRSSDLL
jgi:hypothetical protein